MIAAPVIAAPVITAGHLTVAGSAAVFAATDVDDLAVLTVLFLSARATGHPKAWHIWAGQYVGVGVLVAVSLLAAAGLHVVPDRWVGLLGLLPLALGVRGLVLAARGIDDDEAPRPGIDGVFPVAAATIAAGADNVAVYTPLFRTLAPADLALTVAVFAAGVAVWCLLGAWLGSHRRVLELVEGAEQWLVPVVFVALGVLILARSALP